MDGAGARGDDSDADLMRRTADGDREAFAAVYRRHHATIFRFARLMTGSSAAAEDIVQDVFLAVMREAGRYDPRRASVSTYLYGAARHVTRRRLLREKRFVALEPAAHEPVTGVDPAHVLLQRRELDRLRQAILALPSRCREVVVLCDLQDVNYADAALTLGCPIGTVRSRLHRARTMLARQLHETSAARDAAERHPGSGPLPSSARMSCAV